MTVNMRNIKKKKVNNFTSIGGAVTELPAAYAAITRATLDKNEEIIISAKGETSEKAFDLFVKIKAEVALIVDIQNGIKRVKNDEI